MSFEIPPAIEPEVRAFADSHHISESEAISRLLRAGLNATFSQHPNSIIDGMGMFGNQDDAEHIDAAVALAYSERGHPSSQKIA